MSSHATPPTHPRAPATSRRVAPNHRMMLLALLLAAFALRLFKLGGESLWYDETVSAYLAKLPITELIAHTARDIHPPAYYLLLHLWQTFAHPTVAFGLEFLFAWPSFALSILVVTLIYAITKRAFGSNAALYAIALAMLHPTQIWFAQEVRMYALGACCLLTTLWAALPYFLQQNSALQEQTWPIVRPQRALFIYPLAALLGLYTLYYFLFWLAILNLAVLIRQWRQAHALRSWIVLQIIVLIGWLPWLPIFIRQALTPPVPGWRIPWQSMRESIHALSEAVAALWIGHTPPLEQTFLWSLVVIALLTGFIGYAKNFRRRTNWLWLLLCVGAPLLLWVVSLVGPPIYHVRYVATYAPLVIIPVAALLAAMRRAYALITFLALTALSAATLQQLWTNPRYAADDHRNAVATLAQQWRPGDVILVNAGWAYTALSVYWPTELASPTATRPPAIAEEFRLIDPPSEANPNVENAPIIVRTGSVNGDASLGWGLPESDFFAMTETQTLNSLAQLAAKHPTIWHYRLYDTVSDPTSLIRTWLANNTQLIYSQPIPGRDFLLLEGYRTAAPSVATPSETQMTFPDIGLSLVGIDHPTNLAAGEILYGRLEWQSTITTPTNPAMSLRVVDQQGNLVAQVDNPLFLSQNSNSTQTLALPIPAATIPGDHTLALVIYAPDTLAPYTTTANDGSTLPSPSILGSVTLAHPHTVPHTPPPIATFDYIDLLTVELPTTSLTPGAMLNTAWIWRPQPRDYTDRYIAHVSLQDANGQSIPLTNFTLGGDAYPSSQWSPAYPLRQRQATPLPATLPTGTYTVQLTVTRASDGKTLDARQPWQLWQQPFFKAGELQIDSVN